MYFAQESIAFFIRSSVPVPAMTAHICAFRNILPSLFFELPTRVPSSHVALQYHSPSQAYLFIAFLRSSNFFRYLFASDFLLTFLSERTSCDHLLSISAKKCAIHMDSPFIFMPTKFMPSFQSPSPIKGSPRFENLERTFFIERSQCSNNVALPPSMNLTFS